MSSEVAKFVEYHTGEIVPDALYAFSRHDFQLLKLAISARQSQMAAEEATSRPLTDEDLAHVPNDPAGFADFIEKRTNAMSRLIRGSEHTFLYTSKEDADTNQPVRCRGCEARTLAELDHRWDKWDAEGSALSFDEWLQLNHGMSRPEDYRRNRDEHHSPASVAPDERMEYGDKYRGGSVLVWPTNEPELVRIFPLEDRIKAGQMNGGVVMTRRVIVVEDWTEVPKPHNASSVATDGEQA